MFRTALTRFQLKHKLLNFPLNFQGLSVDQEILRTRYIPMNLRCRQSMSQIFEEDLGEGFRYAFQNVLTALEEKDLGYLKQACEPGLYNEVEKSLDLLTFKDLHVKADYAEEEDLNLKYTSFSYVFGVNADRQSNRQKDLYESSNLFNMKNGIDLKFFKPKFDTMATLPFMRVGCLFSYPTGVYLQNKEGEVIVGQSSSNYHKVVFEGVCEDNSEEQAENVLEAQKSIWKVMSNAESEEKLELTRKIFQVENMTWKIVDIDDHMNGNPYIV